MNFFGWRTNTTAVKPEPAATNASAPVAQGKNTSAAAKKPTRQRAKTQRCVRGTQRLTTLQHADAARDAEMRMRVPFAVIRRAFRLAGIVTQRKDALTAARAEIVRFARVLVERAVDLADQDGRERVTSRDVATAAASLGYVVFS